MQEYQARGYMSKWAFGLQEIHVKTEHWKHYILMLYEKKMSTAIAIHQQQHN